MIRRVLLCCLSICLLPVSVTRAEPVKGVALAHLHARGFGYGSDECRKQLQAIKNLGGNWVALNDFAYMRSVNDPDVRFNRDGSMTRDNLIQTVRDAHAVGLKVLIKPHIWSRDFRAGEKWVGDVAMTSDEDWQTWFAGYGKYVQYNAQLAADAGADALCVGVELEGTSGRQADWRKLVDDARTIFKGPICYSAAFGEWQKIAWWDAVDVIGITAYFPVASEPSPTDEQIRAGWEKVYAQLEPLARKLNRKICFTELGYTPSAVAASEPWSGRMDQPDPDLQARLYRIALEESAKRDVMVGVFVWKWFTSDQWRRHEHADPFAMQNQPGVLESLRAAWRP